MIIRVYRITNYLYHYHSASDFLVRYQLKIFKRNTDIRLYKCK